jgi:hypothetical protein
VDAEDKARGYMCEEREGDEEGLHERGLVVGAGKEEVAF